eukprot:6203597-Pleurochrysis_carterae.AAC.3
MQVDQNCLILGELAERACVQATPVRLRACGRAGCSPRPPSLVPPGRLGRQVKGCSHLASDGGQQRDPAVVIVKIALHPIRPRVLRLCA